MKLTKLIAAISVLAMCGCATNTTTTPSETTTTSNAVQYVDSFTSASLTRSTLADDKLAEAKDTIVSVSSDLASLAETQADGYVEPENSVIAQILSINPDGTPGMSTIHAWQYDKDANTVTVELTDGQNAQNLAKVDAKGTLIVKANGAYYILHLNTKSVEELEYTDEAFEAGEFNAAYSGATNQLSEFSIVFDVTQIDQSFVYMFE